MKERAEDELPQDKDRHLDVPAEAERDNHINFLELEDNSDGDDTGNRPDKETEERQKQWKEGLEEGRKIREGE